MKIIATSSSKTIVTNLVHTSRFFVDWFGIWYWLLHWLTTCISQ